MVVFLTLLSRYFWYWEGVVEAMSVGVSVGSVSGGGQWGMEEGEGGKQIHLCLMPLYVRVVINNTLQPPSNMASGRCVVRNWNPEAVVYKCH